MFQTRYCDQDLFNILASEENGNLIQLSGKDFRRNRPTIKNIKVFKNERIVRGFYIKEDIHVFINKNYKVIILKKYLQISKVWKIVVEFKYRQDFCASVFIGKMFIIGGITFSQDEACTTCIQYDTKTNEKKKEFIKLIKQDG